MNRKKTADAIQKEVARELDQLSRTVFTGIRKSGHVDLEAVEMLTRSAMFWDVAGENSILALRCSHLNGRFEDYWEGRRAA